MSVKQTIGDLEDENIFISVISIGEISKGIKLLEEGKHKRELFSWLRTIENYYSKRLLPIDIEIARLWGEITATSKNSGIILHPCDGLIAATAIKHGLHVMTRNIKDFKSTGVLLTNPWDHKLY